MERYRKKILHIGSACHFTEGMLYQDNLLSEQNVHDGYDVCFVSDCFAYESGTLRNVGAVDETLNNGMRLVRLYGLRLLGNSLSLKLGYLHGLHSFIRSYDPDIVLVHGSYGFAMIAASRFKQIKPSLKLFADIHASKNNSAQNWFSEHILHKGMNRFICHRCGKSFGRFLYIGDEEREFAAEYWGIPYERMEAFPLGGVLPSDGEYKRLRSAYRAKVGISEIATVYLFSGKIDSYKRLPEMLRAFMGVSDDNALFLIAGNFVEGEDECRDLIDSDSRIKYLGWINNKDLIGFCCASDVYLQLGSVSATFQNAVCCRCVGVSSRHTYESILSGSYYYINTSKELSHLFERIASHPEELAEMRKRSFEAARRNLSYSEIAKKMY